MNLPEVGKNYRITHNRFGQAIVRVDAVNEEWADTTILHGVLRGLTETWGAGDKKTVRLEHSKFQDVV